MKRTKLKTRRASISGSRISSYRVLELRRDIAVLIARVKQVRQRGRTRPGSHPARRAIAWRFFGLAAGRGRPVELHRTRGRFSKQNTAKSTADMLGAFRSARQPPQKLFAEAPAGRSFRCSAGHRNYGRRSSVPDRRRELPASSTGLNAAGKGTFVQATPIDVADVLRHAPLGQSSETADPHLSDACRGGNGFDYVQKPGSALKTGANAHRSQPFRLRSLKPCFTFPNHLPNPSSPAYVSRGERRNRAKFSAPVRGRAFVLFTSYQQMRHGLRPRLFLASITPCSFREPGPAWHSSTNSATTPHCVLFATSSFWQGVDVPGDQLSCVIIDKLPFAVPNDPVVEARIRNVRESRGQSFLRLPDPSGGYRAETGLRAADPDQNRPGSAFVTGQPDYATAVRAGLFRQPSRLLVFHAV